MCSDNRHLEKNEGYNEKPWNNQLFGKQHTYIDINDDLEYQIHTNTPTSDDKEALDVIPE